MAASAFVVPAGRADEPEVALQRLYVAPAPRGDGRGADTDHAAGWTDRAFWDLVRYRLDEAHVVVTFADGTYHVSGRDDRDLPRLSLSRMGHDTHRLTLQGSSPDGVTITRYPDDGTGSGEGAGLLRLNRCRNITLRHLHFSAPDGHWMSYATQIDRSRDILIEACSWIDMPNVHHGATGAQRPETENVVYSDCRFIRIGRRTGAHMAYNAYAARRISYINCHFEDGSGDYIRFRSGSDYGVVAGCTFRSTGEHASTHMPFISIPVFNPEGRGEIFGTHFLIFNNRFIYETDDKPEGRVAIMFLHRGFDPPGRRHLIDAGEAEVLASGTAEEKKALLKTNLHVDTDTVHVYGNRYTSVEHRGVYDVRAAYGAASRGGDGRYDVFETFNTREVAAGARDGETYFEGAATRSTGRDDEKSTD